MLGALDLLLHVACQAVCSGRDIWLCRYIASKYGVQAYLNHYAALSMHHSMMSPPLADSMLTTRGDMSKRLDHHQAKP